MYIPPVCISDLIPSLGSMNINLDLQDFLPTDTEAHTDCGSSEEIVETSFRNSSIFFGEASDSCEKV